MIEKNCLNCKYFDQPSFEMKEFCWECLRREELYTRWERKSITKADRVRNMDDYDLAIFLENVSCKHADTQSWLNWLRQEVE